MRSKKKGARRSISIYFLIGATIFFLIGFFLFRLLKASRWDGKRRFTVVFDSKPLAILSIEPRSRRAVFLTFPSNTLLEIPFGYGSYPASSVFKLGQLDAERGGGVLLAKAVENTFGIVVDGFLAPKKEDLSFLNVEREELLKIKRSYFSISGAFFSFSKIVYFTRNVDGNISFVDFFKLWNSVRVLKSNQIAILNIEETKALATDKLPDGTQIKIVNNELFDFVISDYFQDQLIRTQNETVEVVNASEIQGLATYMERILTNLGMKVIVKTSALVPEDFSCRVVFSNKGLENGVITKRLREIYKCSVESESLGQGQTDIKFILGKNFVK